MCLAIAADAMAQRLAFKNQLFFGFRRGDNKAHVFPAQCLQALCHFLKFAAQGCVFLVADCSRCPGLGFGYAVREGHNFAFKVKPCAFRVFPVVHTKAHRAAYAVNFAGTLLLFPYVVPYAHQAEALHSPNVLVLVRKGHPLAAQRVGVLPWCSVAQADGNCVLPHPNVPRSAALGFAGGLVFRLAHVQGFVRLLRLPVYPVQAGDGQATVLACGQAHQCRAQRRAVAGNVFNFRVPHIYPGIVQQVNALRLFFQQLQLRVFQRRALVHVGRVRKDCGKIAVGNLEAAHFVPAARITHS